MSDTISTSQTASPLVKQRDYWFDNAKAILIIAVVIGHLTNGLFSTSTDWIISLKKFIFIFHMPVFMIISGRFAKRRIDKGDWITVTNKLLVPYLLLQTITLLFYLITDYKKIEDFSYFEPLFSLWYYFCLTIYSYISPYLVKFKFLFPVSLIIALTIGFIPKSLYGCFYRVISYYPFFLFGYYTYNMKINFCKKIWFRIISVAVFIITLLFMLKYSSEVSYKLLCINSKFSTIADDMNISLIETFLQNIVRFALGFLFFFFVLGIAPSKKTFFSYIGTNSIYVYSLHIFLIVALRSIDADYDILRVLTNDWLLLAYCLSGIPISFILASKPVRKLTHFIVEPNFDLKKLAKKILEA